jgi:hypothetical protein
LKKQRKGWKSVKKARNKNSNPKPKIFIKRLIRFGLYFILFCVLVFAALSIRSYFWLESLKLDTGEMISDMFEDLPQK